MKSVFENWSNAWQILINFNPLPCCFFFQGHVFLDTMDPSEYYAQALNGHRPAPIKVNAYYLSPSFSRLIDAQIYRLFFLEQMSNKSCNL